MTRADAICLGYREGFEGLPRVPLFDSEFCRALLRLSEVSR